MAESGEGELGLRVDRVELTGPDRLNLGARTLDEFENDRMQLGWTAVPAAGVPGERDAGSAVEPGQQERPVGDRRVVALWVADAGRPDIDEVAAGESVRRQDVTEQVLPTRVGLAERDPRDLSVSGDTVNRQSLAVTWTPSLQCAFLRM